MRAHRLLFPLDILAILFLVSAVLGVQASYNPALSIEAQVGIFVAVGLYFVLAHGVWHWRMAYIIGNALMLAGTIYAAFFILQYAYQGYGETPAFIERLGAVTTLLPDLGIFPGHPNAAATFLEIMIPLGVVLVVTSRRWGFRVFWGVCAFIILYAIGLTFSRGALVALGATFCISLIVLSRRWLVRLVGAGLLVGGVAALMLTSVGSNWALSRWALYQNSLYVASDYLFSGIGLGNTFPLVYARYGLLIQVPFLTYPHNLFLSVWTGQGLLGLVAFLGFVLTFYLFIWRVHRSAQPHRIFHAAWLGVTVSLVHGLFDSRYYVETLWLMPVLFAVFGLAAATGRMALTEAVAQIPETNTRYFPYRLAAVGAVALVAGAFLSRDALQAAWNTNLGALAETRAELQDMLTDSERDTLRQTALRQYQTALTIDPNWSNANRRLGNLRVGNEDFADAIPVLEIAYAHEPANQGSVKGLGLAYMWNGQIDKAATLFEQLAQVDEMVEELGVWGWWRSENGQPLLSAYAWETFNVMAHDKFNLPVWMAIADGFRDSGETDQARLWYERILEQEPQNSQAQQALAALT